MKVFSCDVFVMMDLKEERVMLDLSKEVGPGAWSVEVNDKRTTSKESWRGKVSQSRW